jgi:hypothetical protein
MSSTIIDTNKIQSVHYISQALKELQQILQIVTNEEKRLEDTVNAINCVEVT